MLLFHSLTIAIMWHTAHIFFEVGQTSGSCHPVSTGSTVTINAKSPQIIQRWGIRRFHLPEHHISFKDLKTSTRILASPMAASWHTVLIFYKALKYTVEGTTCRLVPAEIMITNESIFENKKTSIIPGNLVHFCLKFTYNYGFELPIIDFDVMLSKSNPGTRASMSWSKCSFHQAVRWAFSISVLYEIQSNAIITRYNLSRYYHRHCNESSRT